MALQVWLPLNNNMNNYGLTNAYVPPSNLSTYTDGFFGKSLSCNGSTFWAISAFTLGNEATIAHWSKTSTNGKMAWVLECSVSKYLNLFESTIYTLNTGDSNNNPFKTPNNEDISVLHDNKWHHFAVTWGDSVAKLYIDGEYKGTALTFKSPAMSGKRIKLAGGFNDTHSYDWNGQICDFRIYDNCLTPEDVKRLYDCALMDIVATNKNGGFFYDKSGLLINDLVSTGVTYSGNSMYFNGQTGSTGSQIRPSTNGNGLNISGGTLSVWFTPLSAPSDYRIIYIDSVSQMALGFFNNQDVFLVMTKYGDNDSSYHAYKASSISYGQINNATICYDKYYSPSHVYFNGVKATEQDVGVNRWYEPLNGMTIGGRTYNTTSRFNGYISKVTVYKNQLTKQESVAMYEKELPILKEGFELSIQIPHLTFTGTQYIELPQKSPQNNITFVFDFCPDSLSHSQPTFMGIKGKSFQLYRSSTTNMGLWWKSGSSYGLGAFNQNTSNILTISFDSTTFSYTLNNISNSYSNTELFPMVKGGNILIGGYNPGTSYQFFGDLSSIKIYCDGALDMDLISAQGSTNKGLYDKISGVWYYPASGSF